jgi:type II secretory pathway component PulF
MNKMTILLITVVGAGLIALIGMFIVPIFVPIMTNITGPARASGTLPSGSLIAVLADWWPLLVGLGVIGIIVAFIMWGVHKSNSL